MLLALLIIVIVLFVVLPFIGMTIWWLITSAFVGLIIGGLARLVLPGAHRIGLLATILLGWIGSLAGGFVGSHIVHTNRFLTLLIEILIAALLIWLYSAVNDDESSPGKFKANR